MLTDAQARKIACDWHGGGGSALYALCSTGAIDTARADHNAFDELAASYDPLKWSTHSNDVGDKKDLRALMSYVKVHGPRGAVEGWGSLPID